MEIILLQHIDKLGKMGEKVTVKDGYARNFLLPSKKALRANKANLAVYEAQKKEHEVKNIALLESATALSEKLQGFKTILIRQAAETGQLYGSVTMRDVAALVIESGFAIERNQVVLNKPIKYLGIYEIDVKLHPEVSQKIFVNIARTEDEARKQEKTFNKE